MKLPLFDFDMQKDHGDDDLRQICWELVCPYDQDMGPISCCRLIKYMYGAKL